MRHFFGQFGHWPLLFLLTDALFLFVCWLIRPEAMKAMLLFLILFTVFICTIGFLIEYHCRKKTKEALLRFLEAPDTKAELLAAAGGTSDMVEELSLRLSAQLAQINEKTVELASYRDYIEAWVHEAKTPLSLSELVLNNHREEMSPYVYARMSYIQHQLSENVERILYYARLQADHSDYKFTRFRLDECVEEALADYLAWIEEKQMSVVSDLNPLAVVSDKKVVLFLLSQLISNAVKYADGNDGKLALSINQTGERICFGIYNNGEGVPPEDEPFLFDKGFTGSHPNRQKATGMGLYLVHSYAEKLCIEVKLATDIPYESGFGIELLFTL